MWDTKGIAGWTGVAATVVVWEAGKEGGEGVPGEGM